MRAPSTAAVLLVAGLFLAGCSGSGDGGDRADDATTAPAGTTAVDFCEAGSMAHDPELADAEAREDFTDIHGLAGRLAARLREVGTPDDASAEVRAGFGRFLTLLESGDAASGALLGLEVDPPPAYGDLSAAERTDLEAFLDYQATTCLAALS